MVGNDMESWEEDALDVLRRRWGEAYEIEASGGLWRARRRDGLGGPIEAPGPDGLGWAVAEDHAAGLFPARRSARRDGMTQTVALWCRRCGKPVRLEGPEAAEDDFRKAVHAATGEELGADDGHLAAPAGRELAVQP